MDRARHSQKHSQPKIALVCDWLTTPGGAEKVLLELHRMYPHAPIYTSQYSKKGINWFDDATVKTGWLQIFPAAFRKILGPLRQLYFSHLDLSEYDLVISVTGAEAKSIRTHHIHLCYCHVPTQYYWKFYDQYLKNPGFGPLNPLARLCLKLLIKPLRQADFRAAQRPNQFITISSYAYDQIKACYGRESSIVAPPVDATTFSTGFSTKNSAKSTASSAHFHNESQLIHNLSTENQKLSTESNEFSTSFPQQNSTFPQVTPVDHPKPFGNQPYFIIACRQVTWKRIDLAISACKRLKQNLLVVGDGSEHAALIKLAAESPYIKFLPWANQSELSAYLHSASAYLFPSLEPFGVAAVEALAAGCPVIAYAAGGSRDFITSGKNGLLFQEQTPDSLAQAIQDFSRYHFDKKTVMQSAQKFDSAIFRQKITKLVSQALASHDHQSKNTPKEPKNA